MLESESDEIDWISEKYRKYALEIIYNQKSFYILHGADMTTKDEEENYWVDQDHKILLFNNLKQLRNTITTQEYIIFDRARSLLWAKRHKKTQPYSTLNFGEVYRLAHYQFIKFPELTKSQVMETVNFINFFGDYAYQRERAKGDKSLLVLHQEKEVRTFFDYAYDNYIWDDPEHAGYRSLNELDYLRFDEEKFRQHIRQMLQLFMQNTIMSEDH